MSIPRPASFRLAVHIAVIWGSLVGVQTAHGEPPPATPPPTYEALLELASGARSREDWSAALDFLHRAYALRPSPQLLNNIGRTLEELGRYADAHGAFERVANDANAPTDLRALDAARAGALKYRLGSAWVIVEAAAEAVRIDGEVRTLAKDTEIEVPPGVRFFEYTIMKGSAIVLRATTLPAGLRFRVYESLDPAESAVLDLAGATADELHVDGYRIRADVRSLAQVHLTPGAHTLSVVRGGKPSVPTKVTLNARGTAVLASLLPVIDPAWDPDPNRNLGWKIGVGAIGLVLAGIGTWLVVDAANERDALEERLSANALGLVQGTSFSSAEDEESIINRRRGAGIALLSVGLATGAGAAIWAIVDARRTTRGAVGVTVVPSASGFLVEGRF